MFLLHAKQAILIQTPDVFVAAFVRLGSVTTIGTCLPPACSACSDWDVCFGVRTSSSSVPWPANVSWLCIGIVCDRHDHTQGPIDCAAKIVRQEGPLGLWAGAGPTVMRNGTNQMCVLQLVTWLTLVCCIGHTCSLLGTRSRNR